MRPVGLEPMVSRANAGVLCQVRLQRNLPVVAGAASAELGSGLVVCKWCHEHGGRRPKASREGNRDEGYEGMYRGRYWDLIDGCDQRILTAKTIDRDHLCVLAYRPLT